MTKSRNPGLPPPDAIVPQRFVEGIGYVECNSAHATSFAIFIDDKLRSRWGDQVEATRIFNLLREAKTHA